jgi:putative transposase
MSRYRRANAPGGTFFFTVNLADRRSVLLTEHVDLLRTVYVDVQRELPFKTVAICILPDHLHTVWTLSADDADFSKRWQRIKGGFSRSFPTHANASPSKQRQREKGIWQRRFWEHQIRDEADLQRHVDYIHYNPVKHGLVDRVSDWPYSSFHRYVDEGKLPRAWAGGDKNDEHLEVGE